MQELKHPAEGAMALLSCSVLNRKVIFMKLPSSKPFQRIVQRERATISMPLFILVSGYYARYFPHRFMHFDSVSRMFYRTYTFAEIFGDEKTCAVILNDMQVDPIGYFIRYLHKCCTVSTNILEFSKTST